MLNHLIAAFFDWTHRLAPASDELTRLRVNIGMFASLMGVLFVIVIGVPLFVFDEFWAGVVFLGFGLWLLMVIALFVYKKISIISLACLNLGALMITNFIANILLGGTQGSSVLILWSLLGPLLISIVVGPRHMFRWGVVFIVSLLVSMFVPDLLGQTSSLPLGMSKLLFLFDVGGVSIFVLIIVQYFSTQRNLYQEHSDTLLLNIFPPEIAASLRADQRVLAQAFDSASILFADVVGFTALSSTLSPADLVALLNEIFSRFDDLAEKHGLEKIKTIGDCYMVAGGIPAHRPDHAKSVTLMGLDILDFVKNHAFLGQKLVFRIGINSGPVVAGVIGQKKFAYDLWGDAVNIASRMESHGMENCIQITRATYELIKDDFICQPQKPIHVKGKGEMEIWHVLGVAKE